MDNSNNLDGKTLPKAASKFKQKKEKSSGPYTNPQPGKFTPLIDTGFVPKVADVRIKITPDKIIDVIRNIAKQMAARHLRRTSIVGLSTYELALPSAIMAIKYAKVAVAQNDATMAITSLVANMNVKFPSLATYLADQFGKIKVGGKMHRMENPERYMLMHMLDVWQMIVSDKEAFQTKSYQKADKRMDLKSINGCLFPKDSEDTFILGLYKHPEVFVLEEYWIKLQLASRSPEYFSKNIDLILRYICDKLGTGKVNMPLVKGEDFIVTVAASPALFVTKDEKDEILNEAAFIKTNSVRFKQFDKSDNEIRSIILSYFTEEVLTEQAVGKISNGVAEAQYQWTPEQLLSTYRDFLELASNCAEIMSEFFTFTGSSTMSGDGTLAQFVKHIPVETNFGRFVSPYEASAEDASVGNLCHLRALEEEESYYEYYGNVLVDNYLTDWISQMRVKHEKE
jgi:hypothetical protein